MKEIEMHKETISAMLDDELRVQECERCSALMKERPELREAWDTYSLIGDLLRGTPASTLPRSFEERMTAEPTVLAPRSALARRRIRTYAWPAAAAAAGVAFVTWISLSVLPGQGVEVASADRAPAKAAAAAPDAVGAGRGIEDYLLAHQPFSSTTAMQGVAPYVRMVSDQNESPRQ